MEDGIVFFRTYFLYNYKIFILLCIIFLDTEFDIKKIHNGQLVQHIYSL